jgi:hypothetical protein
MSNEDVLKLLRDEAERARTEYEIASECFDAIIKAIPSGVSPTDGIDRIRSASLEHTQALTRMMFALSRLNEFVIHGTVPQDLNDAVND